MDCQASFTPSRPIVLISQAWYNNLLANETIRRFEQIWQKLEKQEVTEFQPLGHSFQVVSCFADFRAV